MQYQVPQFIDTEDKLVGPFSLRQFIYVGAAGMVCGIAYFFLQTWLFVVVAIIFLGGALALAFLKINGRPLIKLAVSAFNYYWKPQTYVWKPEHPVMTQHRQAPAASVRALPALGRSGNDEPHRSSIFARHGANAPANTGSAAGTGGSGGGTHEAAPASPYVSVGSHASAPVAMSTSPAATAAPAEDTRELPPVQTIAQGDALHRSWENLQSGTPDRPEGKRTSDRQFLEKKMAERYQIFQRQSGDRTAARRVDYR